MNRLFDDHQAITFTQFTKEIKYRLFPYNNQNFTILTPNNSEVSRQIAKCIAPRTYSRDINKAIKSLFETIVSSVINFGHAYFLIMENGKSENIKFLEIISNKIKMIKKNRKGDYIANIANEINSIKFKENKVVKFSLPNILKKSNFSLIHRNFKKIDNIIFDDYRYYLTNQNMEIPFKLEEFRKTKAAYELITTKEWGWNLGDSKCEYISEYYFFYKTLYMLKISSILREHLLYQLNEFIKLYFESEIHFINLKSPNDFNHLFNQLETGELSFNEIIHLL